MSTLETRLGPVWSALPHEAGAAAFRVLKVFAALAEQPASQGAPVFRAPKAEVLSGLADQEGKQPSDASLRQRILTLNTASETLSGSGDQKSLSFKLRSERTFLVLEFTAIDEVFEQSQALNRTREKALESTEALITTRGLKLQVPQGEPAQRTYQIMVSRGPAEKMVEQVTDEFLGALADKLATPPAHGRRNYRARLWWAPRDLTATGGARATQTQAAADQSHALLVILSDGWQPEPFHQNRLRADGQCLRVLAAGHLSNHPAPLCDGPVFPLLWAEQDKRSVHGKPFDTLVRLGAKGDVDDWDSLVTRVRDELLKLLDRVDSGEAEQDLTRSQQARTKQGFEHATQESFAREIPGKMQDARGTRTEGEGEPEDLLPTLEAWARGDGAQSRIFALLGSFGTGKTTTAHLFAERLVTLRKADPTAPFPVLLDLKRLSDAFDSNHGDKSLPALMVRSLHPEHAEGIDPNGLVQLLRSEPCVIIFDGLDEVGTRLGVDRTARLYGELLDIVPKAVWNKEMAAGEVDWSLCGARLMVTCRTQFFETYVQQKAVLTGHHRHTMGAAAEGDVHTTTYYMAPFRPDQVLDHFQTTLGPARGREVYNAIERVGDLQALVEKPLMTRYISELAPVLLRDIQQGRKINAGAVYQRLFEEALARDSFKQTAMTVRDRQDLLEALAEMFWRERKPVLKLHELERWFDDYMANSAALGNILRSGTNARALLQTELRNASLLMRRNNDAFAFDHTSFYEYFLARRLFSKLLDGSFGDDQELPPVSQECLRFLIDQVEVDGSETEFGLALDRIFLTGKIAARTLVFQIVGMFRALTPSWTYPPGADLSALEMNRNDFDWHRLGQRPFNGVSFANSSLLQTSFRKIDFQHCDFEGAALSGVSFEGCSFNNCTGTPHETASTRTVDCKIDPVSRANLFGELIFEFPHSPSLSEACRIRVLDFHLQRLNSAVFSPDGSQVLTASDDATARLFDRISGAEVARFVSHENRVLSAVFSPDGAQVLTASADATVRLFDRSSGAEIACFAGHGSEVESAVFSPDGAQVLTTCENVTRLFDRASAAEIGRFVGHGSSTSAVFSPDGGQVLVASTDATARLYDRDSGSEIACFAGQESPVVSAVFSPDGTQVLTTSNRRVKLFDRVSGVETGQFTGHARAVSAVFSPDGTQVLTAGQDARVTLFDRRTGAEITRFSNHDYWVKSAVFSPDGAQILTTSGENTMRIFDRASAVEIAHFVGQENRVASLAFSPDGAHVLIPTGEKAVRVFDVASGAEDICYAGHDNDVSNAVFSPDGAQVLTTSYNGTARLFGRTNETEVARFGGPDYSVASAAFSPDGTQVIIASKEGAVILFDWTSGAETARFDSHESRISGAMLSPDGTQVLAASHATAKLFDRASGAEVARFAGHEDRISSAEFSPDGTQVLTASDDATARLFDRVSGVEVSRFKGHQDWVRNAVFSPDGTQVLTASDDRTVRLFDRVSGAEIGRFAGHDDWIMSAVFSPDGTKVLTACRNGKVKMFDRSTRSLQGGWIQRPDAWMMFDHTGDIVRGGGALWKYVYGLDTSDPASPKVVCPSLASLM